MPYPIMGIELPEVIVKPHWPSLTIVWEMFQLHDDNLSADPKITQNGGSRRCQDRMRLPNLTEWAPERSPDAPGPEQAGRWPIRQGIHGDVLSEGIGRS